MAIQKNRQFYIILSMRLGYSVGRGSVCVLLYSFTRRLFLACRTERFIAISMTVVRLCHIQSQMQKRLSFHLSVVFSAWSTSLWKQNNYAQYFISFQLKYATLPFVQRDRFSLHFVCRHFHVTPRHTQTTIWR